MFFKTGVGWVWKAPIETSYCDFRCHGREPQLRSTTTRDLSLSIKCIHACLPLPTMPAFYVGPRCPHRQLGVYHTQPWWSRRISSVQRRWWMDRCSTHSQYAACYPRRFDAGLYPEHGLHFKCQITIKSFYVCEYYSPSDRKKQTIIIIILSIIRSSSRGLCLLENAKSNPPTVVKVKKKCIEMCLIVYRKYQNYIGSVKCVLEPMFLL